MCIQSPLTIITRDELPKFNGQPIDSIYAMYENSRYENGNYIADILYYNVHIRAYGDRVILKVKDLPQPFNEFLGKVITNKGNEGFITSISFREDGSGNGGFTDESLDLGGWSNNSTKCYFGIYRGCDFMEKKSNSYVINIKSVLGKKIVSTFGQDYAVEEVEFWQTDYKMEEGSLDWASKYPYKHTPIRFVDGMMYKDEKLPTWRPFASLPYMLPSGGASTEFLSGNDLSTLRILDEDNKCHVYVQQVTEDDLGRDNLIEVSFSQRSSDVHVCEGNAYCNIGRYNENYNYDYFKYTLNKINKKGYYECHLQNRASHYNKKNATIGKGSLYKIIKIVPMEEPKLEFEVGDKISVTLPKFQGHLNEFEVVSKTVENDSFGTIKLDYIKEVRPHSKDIHYKSGERSIIVEDLWFNVPDHRNIEFI